MEAYMAFLGAVILTVVTIGVIMFVAGWLWVGFQLFIKK